MMKSNKVRSLIAICVVAVLMLSGFGMNKNNTNSADDAAKLSEAFTMGYYAGMDTMQIEAMSVAYNNVTQEDVASYKTAKANFDKNQTWENAIELYNSIEQIMEKAEQEK